MKTAVITSGLGANQWRGVPASPIWLPAMCAVLVCLAAVPGCNRPPAVPDPGAASPDPDAAAEHATLGQAYFTEGDKARAAAEFSQAIAAQPTVAQHYADRAACLIHLGRTAAALADFDQAIKLDPDNPER